MQFSASGCSAGDRQNLQPHRENELEEEPCEENGSRIREDRCNTKHCIRPLIAEVGGNHSERDTDNERDEHGIKRELERGASVRYEQLRNRTSVGDGCTKVARENLP